MMKAVLFLLPFISLFSSQAHASMPLLYDGDLIFQSSQSRQADAILAATGSPFTHMGIIKTTPKGYVVIEAADRVMETPLEIWRARGAEEYFAVYRRNNISSEEREKILRFAENLYGRPYDIFFSFDNDAIYCSELPYLAYQAAGLSIGKVEKISALNIEATAAQELIAQRWRQHPVCATKNYDFRTCYEHILDQELITPASIADDEAFEQIFSNDAVILPVPRPDP